jgi:putative ABC transport system permease protein
VNLAEIIRFALRGVAANKLRSSLTMLGILIGVAAVILLVAVGNGSAKAVSDRIAALGTNTLTVMSSTRGGTGGLTMAVADALVDQLRDRRVREQLA